MRLGWLCRTIERAERARMRGEDALVAPAVSAIVHQPSSVALVVGSAARTAHVVALALDLALSATIEHHLTTANSIYG